MKPSQKQLVGLVAWACLAVAGLIGLRQVDRVNDGSVTATTSEVIRFVTEKGEVVERDDPLRKLRPGDPIFLADDSGGFRQVGRVEGRDEASGRARLVWYEPELDAEVCQMFQHHSTGRLSEVVEIMMPEEKRRRIREQMTLAMSRHGDEISKSFVPLVRETLKQSLPVIEDEFRAAVARHRGQIDQAAKRWNDEVVEKRLIPLARREILPIVKKHGQPPAEEIGQEIWNRASLWRFGWRAIYDKAPLPKKDLVQGEWQRFVAEEALPVVEAHMDEIVIAIQRSLQDIAANKAIRREVAAVTDEIAADPESRRLIQSILKETFVDNDRLQAVWKSVWSSPEAEAAFEIAGSRLEPVVRGIGDEIFGSEETGIDPNFARVLRSQILHRDRRWIVAWHTGANTGAIEVASARMPYPLVYLANDDQ
ncbi:MAG: hypothetical protein AAFU85_23565 [Planctomycetota bacterium]